MYLKPSDVEPSKLKDEDGNDMEIVEKVAMVEWLAENYKDFGTSLEFVTDKSSEGNQFVVGIGGIGGLLRYQVDFAEMAGYDEESDGFYSDEDF